MDSPPLPDDASKDDTFRDIDQSGMVQSKSKQDIHRSKSTNNDSFETATTMGNGESLWIVFMLVQVYR